MRTTCSNCGRSTLEEAQNTSNNRIYKKDAKTIKFLGEKITLCPNCVKDLRRQLK